MTEEDRKEIKESETDEPQKSIQQHAPSQPQVVSQTTYVEAELDEKETPQPDPLESALKEAEENRDRWIRAVAELENYKKRSLQERSKLLKYRNEELLRDLLSIVDNLGRALSHSDETGRKDPLVEGVAMTEKMFRDILHKYGVTEISALGQSFDPHLHEAIARVPCPENGRPNEVVQEVEKGYMYQDRLLRPTKVVVSTEAENLSDPNEKDLR